MLALGDPRLGYPVGDVVPLVCFDSPACVWCALAYGAHCHVSAACVVSGNVSKEFEIPQSKTLIDQM